jgi:hypothetical protein
MGSHSIGNDGLVDPVRDIGGVLSMESAGSRLGPEGLVAPGIDGFFRIKCTIAIASINKRLVWVVIQIAFFGAPDKGTDQTESK